MAKPKRNRQSKSEPPPPEVLEWRAWPLVNRPAASGTLIIFILAVSAYSVVSFGHAVYGVIAMIVLFGAVADFLLPTGYRLDAEGVTVRLPFQTKRRKWDEFKYLATGAKVMLLTNSADLDSRSARRGQLLRAPDNLDEVRAFVARHLEDITAARRAQGEAGD